MSVEAVSWAFRQRIKPSSAKFVLVALANMANHMTGVTFPSVSYLCEATDQDRKTVLANLSILREQGFIEDTGHRAGATKQVIVYRVNCTESGTVKESQERNSTESGTVPFFPGNSPVFPSKQSQKRDTEPKGNLKGTNNKDLVSRGKRIPDGFPNEEAIKWAAEKRPDLNAKEVAENFRDHWLAKPGKDALKADWMATWRGWVRRQYAKDAQKLDKQADMARFAAVLTGKAKGGIPDFIDMGEAQRVERIER